MNKEKYIPQPIDTTEVKLSEELERLVEPMSKNVHEVWAKARMAQGWKYGPQQFVGHAGCESGYAEPWLIDMHVAYAVRLRTGASECAI